jgi:hypothetical protein
MNSMFKRLRRVRKMTYVLWAWCLAILVWAASATSGTGKAVHGCVKDAAGVLSSTDCTNAVNAGQGIAILVILFVGFIGFVFLSLIWFMSRPRQVQVGTS